MKTNTHGRELAFFNMLQTAIGKETAQRLLRVMNDYGNAFDEDLACVMMYAIEQNKMNKVLTILERHYKDSLQYVHPDARKVASIPGAQRCQAMLVDLLETTLGVKPTATAKS